MNRLVFSAALASLVALFPPTVRAQRPAFDDPASSSPRIGATAGPIAAWRRLDVDPAPAPMRARISTYAVRDPARDRLVLFGGWGFGYFDDTWTLSLTSPVAQWTPVPTPGPHPSARLEHTTVYDPVRHRMLLFGGKDPYRFFNDVWAFDLATDTWSEIVVSGPTPTPRETRAIYDPVRDRVVIFGGFGTTTGHLNQTWALELSGVPSWHQLFTSGPTPEARRGQAVVYDADLDRMILIGGYNNYAFFADVWALDLASATWSPLPQDGEIPSGRFGHTATLDPVRREIVLFGGWNGVFLNDTHVFELASQTWSPIANSAPIPDPRDFHTMIFDPNRDRMVLAIGNVHTRVYDDAWAFDLSTRAWSQFAPPPVATLPAARLGHAAAYDPIGDRLVVFGGWNNGEFFGDTWAISVDAGGPSSTLIAAAGPSRRQIPAIAYDSRRHRMLLFGGKDGDEWFGDLWQLDLATDTWTQLTTIGSGPSPRETRMIYDPVRDRLVLFGGYSIAERHVSETWTLDLASAPSWRRLEFNTTTPAARRGHTLVYDTRRDRMILFGGYDDSRFMNDIWELRLYGNEQWRKLEPRGALPSARFLHEAVYLPDREKMIVFGGYGGEFLGDRWVLDLHGNVEWIPLEAGGPPPSRRDLYSLTYFSAQDRVILFAGNDGSVLGDLWSLDLSGSMLPRLATSRGQTAPDAETPDIASASFALHGFVPNPAATELRVVFALPTAQPALVELYDLAGRRLAFARLEAPRPGPQAIRFERGSVEPGVYLVRLSQGSRTAVTRGVVIR
jgi:N-acetylneuraminic acid mutarotase